MITLIKRLIDISGKNKGKIYVAFLFSFVKVFLSKVPIIVAFVAIDKFYNGMMTVSVCIWIGAIVLVCIILQIIMQILADNLQSTAGYMFLLKNAYKWDNI